MENAVNYNKIIYSLEGLIIECKRFLDSGNQNDVLEFCRFYGEIKDFLNNYSDKDLRIDLKLNYLPDISYECSILNNDPQAKRNWHLIILAAFFLPLRLYFSCKRDRIFKNLKVKVKLIHNTCIDICKILESK